jgi:hypothetical protein
MSHRSVPSSSRPNLPARPSSGNAQTQLGFASQVGREPAPAHVVPLRAVPQADEELAQIFVRAATAWAHWRERERWSGTGTSRRRAAS